jgi:DNA-binding NtrC family response regulator
MEMRFTILIADPNPRIRQFLKREFVADGYHVLLAKNRDELASLIWRDDTLDLLIVDDEILTTDGLRVLQHLGNRIPPLPFILHGYSVEGLHPELANDAAAVVKKTGRLDELKEAVKQALHSQYPRLFDPAVTNAGSSS